MRTLGWILGVLLAAAVVTWPWVLHPTGLLGHPNMEAVDHMWGLWLATTGAGTLVLDTPLVLFPEGFQWVLVDPINLLWFLPADMLGGAPFGLGFVCVANLLLSSTAAALLCGEYLPEYPHRARLLGFVAIAALFSPALSGGIDMGMTEELTMGWAGLSLVAVSRVLVSPHKKWVIIAGITLGLCAWAGPYTAIYAGIITTVVIGFWGLNNIWRRSGFVLVLLRLSVVVFIAACLVFPVWQAIHGSRAVGLPGTFSMAAEMFNDPHRPQNMMLGVDLINLIFPTPPFHDRILYTQYLGIVFCGLVGTGIYGLKTQGGLVRAKPLLATAIVSTVLGLGMFLQVGGKVLTLWGANIVLPAGWLSLLVEELGRASRWYRMVALAVILWAPFAGWGAIWWIERLRPVQKKVGVLCLYALLLMDGVWFSPNPWPRPLTHIEVPDGYFDLDGPFVVIPSLFVSKETTPMRHPGLLWQTFHELPMGNDSQIIVEVPKDQIRRGVKTNSGNSSLIARRIIAFTNSLRKGGTVPKQHRQNLSEMGIQWVVHHKETNPIIAKTLHREFGRPDLETDAILAWKLTGKVPP